MQQSWRRKQGIESFNGNLNGRAIVENKVNLLFVPGTFATVELRLNENRNALMVPTQAVIPQERSKQLIIAKNRKANFVTVITGVRNASSVEVVSGINPGDTVVTTGILFLRQSAALRFSKIKKYPE